MAVNDLIMTLLVGGLLGMVGQGIRIIVGLKKVYDQSLREMKDFSQLFDSRLIMMSLLIGFVAGTLGALSMLDPATTKISKESLLTFTGIGYAGADFIEGFVKKYLPSTGNTETPSAANAMSDRHSDNNPAFG